MKLNQRVNTISGTTIFYTNKVTRHKSWLEPRCIDAYWLADCVIKNTAAKIQAKFVHLQLSDYEAELTLQSANDKMQCEK